MRAPGEGAVRLGTGRRGLRGLRPPSSSSRKAASSAGQALGREGRVSECPGGSRAGTAAGPGPRGGSCLQVSMSRFTTARSLQANHRLRGQKYW